MADSVELAGHLGITTARMHHALASPSEDPDVQPVSFTHLYQQSLYQSLRAGVRQALRAIRPLGPPADLARAVDELIASESQILQRLDRVRRVHVSGVRIRRHGDYRLDELYLVDGEFIVEDFSGDHARPLSERRLRGTPLRDVADMIRSIEYVALVSAIGRDADAQIWAAHWAEVVGDAFMDAYMAEMEEASILPDDVDAIDALLDAFLLERALREIQWELTIHRGWASVPLSGIRRQLAMEPVFVTP
jgi:maltose alpha-D-glucosyltransferase/alpha-amylase